ncbi:MAG: SIMPL domain-containing protein [Acidobacteria bacterium]|nr:SIMPL domain-containing protein [Acidobacteriota bacterium]
MLKSVLRLTVLVGLFGAALAQEPSRIALIYVTGHAEVTAPPDIAVVSLGVTTQAVTVAEAREQNAARMQAVIEAVKKLGVPPQEITTSRFSVTPQYDYREKRNPPRITGYNVSNQIAVRLEAIDKISDVLDGALAAGANDISNLNFTLKDPRKLRVAAYDEAVGDARSKAETLARAAGVQLGEIYLIRESGGVPLPVRRAMAMEAMAVAKTETPVESGEITVQVSVEIQFRIKQ